MSKHSDKEEMYDLMEQVMELLEQREPAIAVAAVSQAFGNAIICSTTSQDQALQRLSRCISLITEMFEEYELEKMCHWEHED